MLHSPMEFCEASLSGWPYLLDELKASLRWSIDCLDLILEHVSGRKRLNVVQRHNIQSFISSLFNVILNLQSPVIFYERSIWNKGDTDPDPGTVIVMCVDVLARISGKHALYQMEAWHIAQSSRIPSAFFRDFHLLKLSEALVPDDSSTVPNNQISNSVVASKHFSGIDRQYSIDLFAACCRLLHIVLKHHKTEYERCIAILQASVGVLLHCLERVDANAVVRKGFF
ncbi:hypothetical protein L3X38_011585 [Prunus dulcis]|uniref:Nucleolar 27S pre-rRNA processing Urb2/Npa2 C-terminal domain-containing protein n=1 Tax=Prunus dulcis TaxID=3755 RepID=A0AAD4WI21_PRUDU|nr:hypothetical protein L3X38_011585 [Prunus dulcis]